MNLALRAEYAVDAFAAILNRPDTLKSRPAENKAFLAKPDIRVFPSMVGDHAGIPSPLPPTRMSVLDSRTRAPYHESRRRQLPLVWFPWLMTSTILTLFGHADRRAAGPQLIPADPRQQPARELVIAFTVVWVAVHRPVPACGASGHGSSPPGTGKSGLRLITCSITHPGPCSYARRSASAQPRW